jgi:NTP pyrophosphatase (non-canonical NTP hydrolase)
MTLADAQRRILEFVAEREWQAFHTPKNLVMALTGEVGELNELFQWLTPEAAEKIMEDGSAAQNVRDELADVFAYLLSLANALDVDLLAAFEAKMTRNEQRFPVEEVRGAKPRRG